MAKRDASRKPKPPKVIWMAWYDELLWGPFKTQRTAACRVAGRRATLRYILAPKKKGRRADG